MCRRVHLQHEFREVNVETPQVKVANEAISKLAMMSAEAVERVAENGNMKDIMDEEFLAI